MRACLAILPILLAACGTPEARMEAGPLPAAALAAAVERHWVVEDGAGRPLGSATAVAPGLLLTNRHVIGGHQGLAIRRPGEAAQPVLTIARAERLDAALLRSAPGAVAAPAGALAEPPAPGAPLTVAGTQDGRRVVTAGAAGSPLEAMRVGRGLAVARIAAAPGFSGGPMLDGQGRLVGIVVAAMLEDQAEARRLSAAAPGAPLAPRTVLYLPMAALRADPGLAALR